MLLLSVVYSVVVKVIFIGVDQTERGSMLERLDMYELSL